MREIQHIIGTRGIEEAGLTSTDLMMTLALRMCNCVAPSSTHYNQSVKHMPTNSTKVSRTDYCSFTNNKMPVHASDQHQPFLALTLKRYCVFTSKPCTSARQRWPLSEPSKTPELIGTMSVSHFPKKTFWPRSVLLLWIC